MRHYIFLPYVLVLILAICRLSAWSQIPLLSDVGKNYSADTSVISKTLREYKSPHPDSALVFYNQILGLSEKINFPGGIAKSMLGIGTVLSDKNEVEAATLSLQKLIRWADSTQIEKYKIKAYSELGYLHFNTGKATQASHYADSALQLAVKYNNVAIQISMHSLMGNAAFEQYNPVKAMKHYVHGLRLARQTDNKMSIGNLTNNIGLIYETQKNYDKAIENYEKALVLFRELNAYEGMGNCQLNIGNVFSIQGDNQRSLLHYYAALALHKKAGSISGENNDYISIGNAYQGKKEYKNALHYMQLAKNKAVERGDEHAYSGTLLNIGGIYLEMKRYRKALEYVEPGMDIATKNGYLEWQRNGLMHLHEIHAALNNKALAYTYALDVINITDTMFNTNNTKIITELQSSYDLDTKQAEINLLNKDKQLQDVTLHRQQIIIGSVVMALFIITVFAFAFYRQNTAKRKANNLLQQQNVEINQKNEEIAAQRDDILEKSSLLHEQNAEIAAQRDQLSLKQHHIESSIRYAHRIQSALLPQRETISAAFKDHFILYKPRDIVSGDFYWYAYKNGQHILAAIDCTGHGVPGAFMSMVGETLLNQIIWDKGLIAPHEIVQHLHNGIRKALKQNETDNADGMDLALCVIDIRKQTLDFCGAKNPLLVLQNGELTILKADRRSVGGVRFDSEELIPFTTQQISIKKPTTIYLYSDGYEDQLGGPRGQKLGSKRLREYIEEFGHMPLGDQQAFFTEKLQAWMNTGTQDQTDDILLMGIKIPKW